MNFIEEMFAGIGMAEAMERTILDELSALKEMLKRIEALLEERLIGIEEPLADEVRAIEEYEGEKKSGELELVRLEDVERAGDR